MKIKINLAGSPPDATTFEIRVLRLQDGAKLTEWRAQTPVWEATLTDELSIDIPDTRGGRKAGLAVLLIARGPRGGARLLDHVVKEPGAPWPARHVFDVDITEAGGRDAGADDTGTVGERVDRGAPTAPKDADGTKIRDASTLGDRGVAGDRGKVADAPGRDAPGPNAPGRDAPGPNAPGPNAPGRHAPGRGDVRPPKLTSASDRLRDRMARDKGADRDIAPVLKELLQAKFDRTTAARKVVARRLGRRGMAPGASPAGFVPADENTQERRHDEEAKKLAAFSKLSAKRGGIGTFRPVPSGGAGSADSGSGTPADRIGGVSAFLASIPGGQGSGWISRKPPHRPCKSRKKSAGALGGGDVDEPEAPLPPETSDTAATNNATMTGQMIEAKLREILASPSLADTLASRADADTVRAALERPLASGPADQTAYYDFDTLHIAWQDSWSAALSDLTVNEVTELYEKVVQLVDYTPPEPRENAEVNELEALLADLAGVVTSIGAELVCPAYLADWLGDDTISEVWSAFSVADQEVIVRLKALDDYARDYPFEGEEAKSYERTSEGIKKLIAKKVEIYGLDRVHHEVLQLSGKEGTHTYEVWVDDATSIKVRDTAFSGTLTSDMENVPLILVRDKDYAMGVVQTMVDNAQEAIENGVVTAPLGRAEQIIEELQRRSDAPYQFDVFLPNSVNFGLISRYRQKWQPLAYQAGDLAGTLPLAPGEKRSFTVKRTRTMSQKSTTSQSALTSRNEEFNTQMRSEAEINRRVQQAVNAGANVASQNSVGGQVGLLGNGVSGSTSLNFGGTLSSDTSSDSAAIKKDLSDTTRKMTQEFRDENKVEISTETGSTFESTETREISNPNNEISVTYLFYELQRQYEVSARLNEIIPVVLVAFHVPNPDQITETWLLKHEWIIRKALLDRSFLPVLEVLRTSFTGDEVAVEVLEVQWKTQLSVVAELRRQMGTHTDLRDAARDAVNAAAREASRAMMQGADTGSGGTFGEHAGEALEYAALGLTTGVGGVLAKALFDRKSSDEDDSAAADLTGEALGSERDSARQALDWADLDRAQSEGALREGIGALERATERYLDAVRARLNRRSRIDQLILHVKTNILHYMHAIWRAEHPDQRYFRLYDLKIPWGDDELSFTDLSRQPPPRRGNPAGSIPGLLLDDTLFDTAVEHGSMRPDFGGINVDTAVNRRPLHEVADLDRILGFRGNYAAFRLRESNLITLSLLQDFLHTELGLIDPDADGNLPTSEEALEWAACAWEMAAGDPEKERMISERLVAALDAAVRVSQEVTIPTGELFIEALPGTHPVLEDFKLRHRAADAEKAALDARILEVELLRRAKRLVDGDTTDPDVDRVIQVQGSGANVHVDTD